MSTSWKVVVEPDQLQLPVGVEQRLRVHSRMFANVASLRSTAASSSVCAEVADVPGNFAKGELVVDTAMELETNASTRMARENSLLLRNGKVSRGAVVKIAQTFRSGTSDVDALAFADLYLGDPDQTDPDQLNDVHVLVNFRPAVTKMNWRMDCGVAGYDNTVGLPPFFPTRLRFEDYVYRLWIQQPGIAAAHVDAAQTHIKNNYMRHPLAFEVFNEEVANLLKRKIRATLAHVNDLSIEFDYEGEVTAEDSQEIIERIRAVHGRALAGATEAKTETRKHALEICYFRKHRKDLPQTKVRNQKRA